MRHSCPYGFVVPNNVNDTRITLIGNTGCALACISPYFTPDEWIQENNEILICSALGSSFPFIFLVTWIFDKTKSKQYIFVSMGVCTCIVSLINIISSSILPLENRFCINSAVPILVFDGINICIVQAVSNAYFSLAVAFCWAVQAIDLFFRVSVGMKNTDKYRLYYMITIIVPPAIPVGIALQSGKMGYPRTNLNCGMIPDNNYDIYSLFIPFLAMTIVVLVLTSMVLIKLTIVVTNKNLNRSSSLWDTIKVFRTSILSLLVFLLYFIVIVFTRALKYQSQSQTDKYMNEWTDCMFDSFYQGTDWKSVCGTRPKGRTPLSIFSILHVFAFGIGIFYSLIHLLSKSVFLIWTRRGNAVLTCFRAKNNLQVVRQDSVIASVGNLYRAISSKSLSRHTFASGKVQPTHTPRKYVLSQKISVKER